MFGPLYHAAALMGIPAAQLDASPPYVVAMMVQAPTTPEEVAAAETAEIMRAKIAARAAGKTVDVMAL